MSVPDPRMFFFCPSCYVRDGGHPQLVLFRKNLDGDHFCTACEELPYDAEAPTFLVLTKWFKGMVLFEEFQVLCASPCVDHHALFEIGVRLRCYARCEQNKAQRAALTGTSGKRFSESLKKKLLAVR